MKEQVDTATHTISGAVKKYYGMILWEELKCTGPDAGKKKQPKKQPWVRMLKLLFSGKDKIKAKHTGLRWHAITCY